MDRPLDYFETLRRLYNVPIRLQRYVCTCEPYAFSIEPQQPPNACKYWVCKGCKKLPIWHFFQCFECEEYFLHDFHHPDFCGVDALCWDCLNRIGPICDCTHPPVVRVIPTVPPYLPKPREFTPEELTDVFDF